MRRTTCPILLTVCLCCLTLTLSATAAEDGFESIFDGKSLQGWEGNSDFWSVKDGAITGQTTEDQKLTKNTFLIWRDGKLGDFELHLKFRIENGNSGIQYRSEELPEYVVKGYQADIDATMRYMGICYEERGRGILAERGQKVTIQADGAKEVAKEPAGDGKAIVDSFKKDGWNDYVIIAKGNHLIQKINGHTSIEIIDEQSDKAAKAGILALQLHVGPPMIVQFKDIQLKKLD